MGADDDDAVRVAARRLGDHVPRRPGLVHAIDLDARGRARRAVEHAVAQLVTDGERRADRLRGMRDGAAERPVDDPGAARLALVEDNRGDGACGCGICRLDVEPARAALHERDRGRRVKPAKSLASHPLVLPFIAPGDGTTRSTAETGAVSSPFGENVIDAKSTPSTYAFGLGLVRWSTAGVRSALKTKSKYCDETLYPAAVIRATT